MINYIWFIFLLLGVIFGIINKIDLTTSMISSGTKAINMILSIVPLMCLWLGAMKIAESSGLLDIISKKLSKVVRVIFPEIPDGDPSISYISSNIVMNMLGLGNAATPFGLKAMKELQRLNNTTTASRSMITFLVINTSSVTIIPTTVISIRILNNSINPTSIVPLTIITTFISTFLALVLDRLFYILWRKRYD
jgi:spore maturation protein